MDQAGALLAGWWIMVREGVPDDRSVREGIAALDPERTSGYIRLTSEVDEEDRPRRAVQHLLSSMVALHRSTDREPLGRLLSFAFGEFDDTMRTPDSARELLTHYGIRVVLGSKEVDRYGRPVPRMSAGDGVWFSNTSPELAKLFNGTPFEDGRWLQELRRLESARRGPQPIKIGTVATRAVWVSRRELPSGSRAAN